MGRAFTGIKEPSPKPKKNTIIPSPPNFPLDIICIEYLLLSFCKPIRIPNSDMLPPLRVQLWWLLYHSCGLLSRSLSADNFRGSLERCSEWWCRWWVIFMNFVSLCGLYSGAEALSLHYIGRDLGKVLTHWLLANVKLYHSSIVRVFAEFHIAVGNGFDWNAWTQ